MTHSSLTHALAAAVADDLWFVEGSEDEQMNPDDAVKVLEGVAHLVSRLSSDASPRSSDEKTTMRYADSARALLEQAAEQPPR
ncbi:MULTISPECIES: hypothetical protein [Streptomyces]|uniref:hypothetical protein n=1 Tax=Streptomyces TaxID=1883 RepID=UPI002FDC222E